MRRVRGDGPSPLEAAFGTLDSRAMFERGLHETWSPYLRLELADSYGFPDGFLGALRACFTAHDVLVRGATSPLFVVWQRRWLSWTAAREAMGRAALASVRYHAGGIVSAEVTAASAVRAIAWLGVAHDYPQVQPKVPARLFLVAPRAGWAAHVYDDRGMVIAVRTARAAAALARRLTAAGATILPS